MKVKELMRTSVAKVSPAATVGEVLGKMDGSGGTSLPVEGRSLVGALSLAEAGKAETTLHPAL
jgi:CBS domain-containing protein